MSPEITKKETALLPTEFGTFTITVFEDAQGLDHAAVYTGISKNDPVLVRIHSECLTGDVFHSLRCDCKEQLHAALKMIAKQSGVVIYLRQEGRGIGLLNKIRAYNLQDRGMDTVEANEQLGFKADQRDYTFGMQMLADLGIKKIRLLTNNPKKMEGFENSCIEIVERVPLLTMPTKQNKKYLDTKKEKMGHYFENKDSI